MIIKKQIVDTQIIRDEISMLTGIMDKLNAEIVNAQTNLYKISVIREQLSQSVADEPDQLEFDFEPSSEEKDA